MTLEEAQEQIVALTEQVQDLTTQNETLSGDNEKLVQDLENMRTLNQKYFNKLIAQDDGENNNEDNPPEVVPTCEEFAATLKY